MTQTSTSQHGTLLELRLDQLKPATDNVRRDVGDITELAASIKSMGLLEPLVAVEQDGHYLIVAGARRHAAAKKAGLKTVPVMVREMTEQDRVEAMLIENLQRTDLTAREEAYALQRLVDEFKVTQRELATRIGRSQSHISKRLSLVDLPEMVLEAIDSGGISLADAAEIAKLGGDTRHIQIVFDRVGPFCSVEAAVETQLDRIEREKGLEAAAVEAEGQGHRVVRQIVDGYYVRLPKGTYRLEKGANYGDDVLNLDPKKHASEPCHAVYVDERTGKYVPVCTDRRNHPAAKTPSQRERARYADQDRERRDKSEGEAERRAALEAIAEARRAFVHDLLRKKAAIGKNEALELILRMAAENAWHATSWKGQNAFRDYFEVDDGMEPDFYSTTGIPELTKIALAATFIALEEMRCDSYSGARDNWDTEDADYLQLLERYGYEISDVERELLPDAAFARAAAA